MRTHVLCCSLIAAIAAAAAPSRAQTAVDANRQAAVEQARQHHIEGDTRYANGDYAGAHAAYSAAWSLNKHYQIAGNLGDCEMKLGRYRNAAEHLAYFIRNYPADKPIDRLDEGKNWLAVARSRIGTITVVVDAPGAEILVDGNAAGRAPLEEPLYLDPGSRVIAVRKGSGTSRSTVHVTPGLTETVTLRLVAAPKPAPKETKAAWEKRLLPLLATAGGSLVSIGTGIGFAAASNGKADERDAIRGQMDDKSPSGCVGPSAHDRSLCENRMDRHEEARTFRALSISSFVLGGLAAAGAAAIVVWPERSSGSRRVEAMPVVGPGGVAFGLKGTF